MEQSPNCPTTENRSFQKNSNNNDNNTNNILAQQQQQQLQQLQNQRNNSTTDNTANQTTETFPENTNNHASRHRHVPQQQQQQQQSSRHQHQQQQQQHLQPNYAAEPRGSNSNQPQQQQYYNSNSNNNNNINNPQGQASHRRVSSVHSNHSRVSSQHSAKSSIASSNRSGASSNNRSRRDSPTEHDIRVQQLAYMEQKMMAELVIALSNPGLSLPQQNNQNNNNQNNNNAGGADPQSPQPVLKVEPKFVSLMSPMTKNGVVKREMFASYDYHQKSNNNNQQEQQQQPQQPGGSQGDPPAANTSPEVPGSSLPSPNPASVADTMMLFDPSGSFERNPVDIHAEVRALRLVAIAGSAKKATEWHLAEQQRNLRRIIQQNNNNNNKEQKQHQQVQEKQTTDQADPRTEEEQEAAARKQKESRRLQLLERRRQVRAASAGISIYTKNHASQIQNAHQQARQAAAIVSSTTTNNTSIFNPANKTNNKNNTLYALLANNNNNNQAPPPPPQVSANQVSAENNNNNNNNNNITAANFHTSVNNSENAATSPTNNNNNNVDIITSHYSPPSIIKRSHSATFTDYLANMAKKNLQIDITTVNTTNNINNNDNLSLQQNQQPDSSVNSAVSNATSITTTTTTIITQELPPLLFKNFLYRTTPALSRPVAVGKEFVSSNTNNTTAIRVATPTTVTATVSSAGMTHNNENKTRNTPIEVATAAASLQQQQQQQQQQNNVSSNFLIVPNNNNNNLSNVDSTTQGNSNNNNHNNNLNFLLLASTIPVLLSASKTPSNSVVPSSAAAMLNSMPSLSSSPLSSLLSASASPDVLLAQSPFFRRLPGGWVADGSVTPYIPHEMINGKNRNNKQIKNSNNNNIINNIKVTTTITSTSPSMTTMATVPATSKNNKDDDDNNNDNTAGAAAKEGTSAAPSPLSALPSSVIVAKTNFSLCSCSQHNNNSQNKSHDRTGMQQSPGFQKYLNVVDPCVFIDAVCKPAVASVVPNNISKLMTAVPVTIPNNNGNNDQKPNADETSRDQESLSLEQANLNLAEFFGGILPYAFGNNNHKIINDNNNIRASGVGTAAGGGIGSSVNLDGNQQDDTNVAPNNNNNNNNDARTSPPSLPSSPLALNGQNPMCVSTVQGQAVPTPNAHGVIGLFFSSYQPLCLMAAAAGTMFRCPGNNSRVVDREIAVSRLSNYGMVNDLGAGLSGTVCLVKHSRTGEMYVAKAMKWAKRRAGDGAAAAEAKEREQQQREQALSNSRRSLGDTTAAGRRSSAYSQFSAVSTGTRNNPIYNNFRRSGAVGLNSSNPHPGQQMSPFPSARNTNTSPHAFYSPTSGTGVGSDQSVQREPPLSPADKQHIEFLKRVARQDVELLSNCAHPNVVEYIDSIETEAVIFLVMEFLDGGDLKAELVNRKRIRKAFSPVSAMRFFVQMLLSVQFLHERGIFHRDVKPSNFMMKQVLPTSKSSPALLTALHNRVLAQQQQQQQAADDGGGGAISADVAVSPQSPTAVRPNFNNQQSQQEKLPSDTLTSYCNKFVLVKLGDFGFALRSHEERGDAAGTPTYAAPEMYSPVTHSTKADIWSLGVLLYELVTLGKPPVTGTDFAKLRVDEAERKFHEEGLKYPTATPEYIKRVVEACLIFDPAKRPSADELFRRFPVLATFGHEYVDAFSLLRPDQHGMTELRAHLNKYAQRSSAASL